MVSSARLEAQERHEALQEPTGTEGKKRRRETNPTMLVMCMRFPDALLIETARAQQAKSGRPSGACAT